MNNIRTRFAPSPTGYLHIGSLRPVLIDFLIARSLGGKLILRIEDTDQSRQVPGAIEKLVDILNWLGMEFDEGPGILFNKTKDVGEYGPYIQSQRKDIYNKYLHELMNKGGAYPCFCTPERLEKMRNEQQAKKLAPRYDRHCRYLSQKAAEDRISKGERFVIRQKMPLEGIISVIDALHGEIKFKAQDLDDHVLIKADGMPTYQFASVVDDHDMRISHVVRGDEWLSSFPKNILLYQAFDWQAPTFIHLPLVLDPKGGKLSKRKRDVAVEDYRQKGYLPQALINFSALLGWRPKHDQEIFLLEELIKEFKIKDMGTSPAIFDITKLDFLNGYAIRNMEIKKLVNLCRPYIENYKNFDEAYLEKVIKIEQERIKKLSDITELTKFFFIDELHYPQELLIWKKLDFKEIKSNLDRLLIILSKISEKKWEQKILEKETLEYLKNNNLGVGDYLWPMRVALTGEKNSPGPFEVAGILGKEKSMERIQKAIDML